MPVNDTLQLADEVVFPLSRQFRAATKHLGILTGIIIIICGRVDGDGDADRQTFGVMQQVVLMQVFFAAADIHVGAALAHIYKLRTQ